jgi:hypothetical protein
MPASASLSDFLTALKAFLHTLAARPDVRLSPYRIGPPAPPELLAQLRGRLPAEWLELAALANGISVSWEFLQRKQGQGLLFIRPLTADTTLEEIQSYEPALEPGRWKLQFDQPNFYSRTWLVLDHPAAPNDFQLLFVQSGVDEAPRPLGPSLAAYLHQALAAGLVCDWPQAESQPAVQAVVQRILTPAASKLAPGQRVESGAFSSYCRGEVLQLYALGPQEQDFDYTKPYTSRSRSGVYALIRYDLGYTFWQGADYLKALPKKPDTYEALRADPWLLVRWGETEGWATALARMALLWGPITGNFAGYVDSSWLVAALLRPLSLNEGAELLRRVAAGVQASGLDLKAPLPLPEAERPLARRRAADWRRRNWEATADTPLQILINGYCARVLVEPKAGREELSFETLDELEAFAVWGEPNPFYHTRRLLVLNNDEHHIYFEDPLPELPADYPIITHSAY